MPLIVTYFYCPHILSVSIPFPPYTISHVLYPIIPIFQISAFVSEYSLGSHPLSRITSNTPGNSNPQKAGE